MLRRQSKSATFRFRLLSLYLIAEVGLRPERVESGNLEPPATQPAPTARLCGADVPRIGDCRGRQVGVLRETESGKPDEM